MFCALMLGVALFCAWCGGRTSHEGATIGCAVDADNEKMHLWAMRGECVTLREDVWMIVWRQSERRPVVWCKYTTIGTACQAFFAKNGRLLAINSGCAPFCVSAKNGFVVKKMAKCLAETKICITFAHRFGSEFSPTGLNGGCSSAG